MNENDNKKLTEEEYLDNFHESIRQEELRSARSCPTRKRDKEIIGDDRHIEDTLDASAISDTSATSANNTKDNE